MTTTNRQAADAEDGYFAPLGTGNHAPDPDVYGDPTGEDDAEGREAAAAEAADEAYADGATLGEARSVYAARVAGPDPADDADPPPIIDRGPLRSLIAGGDNRPGVDLGRLDRAARLVDEIEAEERDVADVLAEITHLANTGLRDLAKREINPDVVMLSAAALLHEQLARLDAIVGTTPPRGWTLETAPLYSTVMAPTGDVWINQAIGVKGGLPWYHADGRDPGDREWYSTSELERRGAVVVSVPVSVGVAPAPMPAAETPADDSESSLVPVDPDSPAGRVAAQLVEDLGEHLGDAGFSIGLPGGVLVANVAPWAEVEHLRAVARAFPDAKVWANDTSSHGILTVIVQSVRDDIPVQISAVLFARQVEEQAAARSWLAELGVEVSE